MDENCIYASYVYIDLFVSLTLGAFYNHEIWDNVNTTQQHIAYNFFI